MKKKVAPLYPQFGALPQSVYKYSDYPYQAVIVVGGINRVVASTLPFRWATYTNPAFNRFINSNQSYYVQKGYNAGAWSVTLGDTDYTNLTGHTDIIYTTHNIPQYHDNVLVNSNLVPKNVTD